jgi:tRNA 2-thiouridine synthesizing protein B
MNRIASNDGLLLMQDAVYVLQHSELSKKLGQLNNVYILTDDLEARALNCNLSYVHKLNYDDFVKLSLDYEKVLSW